MQVHSGLLAAGATDSGLQREINEDRYHYDPVRGVFIVVDGVGGQAAGEKAAETALATIRTRLERETGPVADRVRESIALANDEIYRLASLQPQWKGMACVVTVAVVTNGDMVVGHVGDSRLYKLRGGRIEKLTRDHSPVGEREDAGELSERDAMQHPRRNEVYRDVGSEPRHPDDEGFIDIARHPFEPDAALLLCSDGLTDMVPSGSIVEIVREYAGRPYDVTRALIDAANAAGGKDNVTVVYVEGAKFANGDDTRDLRAHRVAENAPPAPAASPRWRLISLVLLLLVVSGLALYAQWDRLGLPPLSQLWPARAAPALVTPRTVTVRPGESIAAALERAVAGAEIVVEPGEYRERLVLKSHVRVVSRVPRAAALRLPGDASERDPAVVALDVTGAELSGFRIVGDAATPLGAGVVVRASTVTLSDLEISGAQSAAVEFAAGAGGTIVAGAFHDNPGAAIVVRSGASPRIAHNAFVRNAASERAAGTLVVEAGAHPVITSNTFFNLRPGSLIVPPGSEFLSVARDNWFVPADTPAPRGGTRGRR